MSGWQGSTRRARLPRDWATRRAKVKRRAKGKCEAEAHVPECDGYGSECDHIDRGDDHRLSNLQWLSGPCHQAKTLRENQARTDSRRLPREAHPSGL